MPAAGGAGGDGAVPAPAAADLACISFLGMSVARTSVVRAKRAPRSRNRSGFRAVVKYITAHPALQPAHAESAGFFQRLPVSPAIVRDPVARDDGTGPVGAAPAVDENRTVGG